MIGIVIVSHSHKIADGVIELSSQMAQSNINIIPAAGTDDGRIGTDVIKIKNAIIKADTGEGVIVLADIGSSVMSTEMAFEMLDDELRQRVFIADAPLVEGAIGAVVQVSIGGDLNQVKKAAEEAKTIVKIIN
ncbi:dihydroxyacetone kinase phosphoryl donor subunit DhaM [Senegalia massiliensis]|uniref:phosphoenolpyruvate--glycerone phosphotransferase n=1 Tax=Senegalia massiliensis TaxID=1720316 RepID=A0A845QVW3_9CLOT|nr:dihydroxyacetone kinase phosphoryl donor subunit DhaM [Senegalia massiliensis]NBI06391.1 PTS-dependent dihydroxyacetone kinase phosphotransferase subunit DhaM [Senegalia massiliensis]